jgi:hypothetical protein
MVSRLKFDISDLIDQQFSHFPTYIWESDNTTFCDLQMGGGQFIQAIGRWLRKYGHSDDNIKKRVFGFSEKPLYLSYIKSNPSLIGTFDIYNDNITMKFDVQLGNDPYQKVVGPNKTEPIWDFFVQKRLSLLNDNGYLALIHPSGWRNIDGRFKNIQNIFKNYDLMYLEMHDVSDGIKLFGVETRYDIYILNKKKTNILTKIKFEDGTIDDLDLKKLDFIPNSNFDYLYSLIAKDNEETVDIVYSSSIYETRKKYVSKNKNNNFINPIISMVRKNGDVEFNYSSIPLDSYFNKPKVVWSNTRIDSIGTFIDSEGKFGMTQFNYGISDKCENLENISKALKSQEFINIMKSCITGGFPSLNYKILSLFRKDFWKYFI